MSEREQKEQRLSEWEEYRVPDTNETMRTIGYECQYCGFIATKLWAKCPYCKRKMLNGKWGWANETNT